jgi:anthranilate/para-aminobenzoate synthase component II
MTPNSIPYSIFIFKIDENIYFYNVLEWVYDFQKFLLDKNEFFNIKIIKDVGDLSKEKKAKGKAKETKETKDTKEKSKSDIVILPGYYLGLPDKDYQKKAMDILDYCYKNRLNVLGICEGFMNIILYLKNRNYFLEGEYFLFDNPMWIKKINNLEKNVYEYHYHRIGLSNKALKMENIENDNENDNENENTTISIKTERKEKKEFISQIEMKSNDLIWIGTVWHPEKSSKLLGYDILNRLLSNAV